jgi:uncharacterized protein (TIGR02246 family)
MKMVVVAALFALMASAGAAQTPADEIERANREFVQALNEGDAAMVARMYTERAIVLPPNADMIVGREAIHRYWRSVIDAGLRNLSLRSVRVDEYGDDAVREIGRFSAEPPGPRDRTGRVEGKYVTVWRKSGGHWQHDSDIWNFTEPPQPDGATGTSAAPTEAATGTSSPPN